MNDNISFPPHFIALKKWPGYFWHDVEKKLYSMKITGVLSPLKSRIYTKKAVNAIWNRTGYDFPTDVPIYRLSNKKKRLTLVSSEIEKYLDRKHVIPVQLELFK